VRIAIPGLITLALVAAGGFYAWENYLKPEEKERMYMFEDKKPAGVPSAEVSARDILRFLPPNSEKAAFVDVRSTFGLWSSTLDPNEPVANPIDDFVLESSGLGLSQLDYACIGGNADTSEFSAVIGFGTDLNPAELYAGIERTGSRLLKVESINEVPMRILDFKGTTIELVLIDQRTILVTSKGAMKTVLGNSERKDLRSGPVIAALGRFISDQASLAIVGTPATMDMGATLSSFGCPPSPEFLSQIESMETIALSFSALSELEGTISFNATDADEAARMAPQGSAWISSAPEGVRRSFELDFPGEKMPQVFAQLLESAEWATARKVNKVRVRLPQRQIGQAVKAFSALGKTRTTDTADARMNAKRLAGIYAAAIAAGNTDLPRSTSVDQAVTMLVRGVEGEGAFEGTLFKSAPLGRTEADAASRYLLLERGQLVYRFSDAAKPRLQASRSDADSRRTAQQIAAVFSGAKAAGAKGLNKVTNVEGAIQKISDGVTGTGDFSDSRFQIPGLSARERENASRYLALRSGQLEYTGN